MKYLTLVILSLVLTACKGGNAPEVRIMSATYAGSGCPAEKGGEIILTPDRKTLSVLFDGGYEVEAGMDTGPTGEGPGLTKDNLSCNIAVSLHIPSGYQALLIGANYKGEVSLPEGGEAKFKRQYFFAGDESEAITETFNGEVFAEDIDIFDDLHVDSYSYSRCGEDVILRSSSSLSVQVPDATSEVAFASIDSFDYKHQRYNTQFFYQFSYEKCT